MRLTAQARLFLPGEPVFRDPTFMDKLRSALGGDPDRRTGEIALTRSAIMLTEQIRQALGRAGIDNAVTLLADDDVLFVDADGTPGDADLLVNAVRESAGRFERGFEVIRAVFEHAEHGMELLIEVTVNRVHKMEDPSATFALSGRLQTLRPLPGEDTEHARERIAKQLADADVVATGVRELSALVGRLEKGAVEAFPRAIVETDDAAAMVVRPDAAQLRAAGATMGVAERGVQYDDSARRVGVYYDPWPVYYRDPLDTWVNLMVLDAMTSPYHMHSGGQLGDAWLARGVDVAVVNSRGVAICSASEVDAYEDNFTGVHDVAELDFNSGSWSDESLSFYEDSEKTWSDWDCTAPAASWDCSSSSSSSTSWDCSSDCSYDCSSDCSYDCSSDCSWD